jgi:DNA-binding NtrC family response regulator
VNPRVLLVEDEPSTLFAFSRFMGKAGYSVTEATSLTSARETVASGRFDVVILDLNLPDGNGIDWIPEIKEEYPATAIVVITGSADVPLAVEAMRRGADNFLTKPVSLVDLDIFLRKSLEVGNLRRKNLTHKWLSKGFEAYFGESAAIRAVMELSTIAAENGSVVLLQGETGTGKGVLARWIYHHSANMSGPFVEINCSGLKGELLASELFGHVRGAFTSAVEDKPGLIEVADGGTLFLDEIADMDLAVQAQFLKVIEEKSFRRVGDVRTRRSNFRLITATNKDLAVQTGTGHFRSDLFFRINVFPVVLPPLRERVEDLDGLASHILASLRAPLRELSSEVRDLLKSYAWPGNVRELRNVLERALLISRGQPLRPRHFPGLDASASSAAKNVPAPSGLAAVEEAYIRSVVEKSGGDVRKAAAELNMSRATLYRKLKKTREH